VLYAKDGKLKYCYHLLGIQHFFADSNTRIPAGQHQVPMEFEHAGGGLGKGGTVSLFVDGQKVGEVTVAATALMIFSCDDGCDVGVDTGAPVSPDYKSSESAFNGRVRSIGSTRR
jgi:arylsulfatase